VYEGVPRLLDLMDKHQVKLSSFMIGQAVEKAPDLAREIVRRGHEAAAHGRCRTNKASVGQTQSKEVNEGSQGLRWGAVTCGPEASHDLRRWRTSAPATSILAIRTPMAT
jgi:hypothetical protein